MDQNRQRSLAQALNSNVRRYGKAIITNLAIAAKTTQLYSFAHQNVTEALRELEEYLVSFLRLEGTVDVERVDDFLFVNDVRAKVELGGLQAYQYVLALLRTHGIGAISFKPGVSSRDIAGLIDLLIKAPAEAADPWPSFQKAFGEARIETIQVSRYEPNVERRDDTVDDRRTQAIQLYFRTICGLEEVVEATRQGRHIALKRLKRLTQSMVDLVLEEEPTLLALVNLKDHRSRFLNHSVNVAVLSVALGTKLGLSKKLLGDLGIAALLHDIGKTRLPEDLQNLNPRHLEGERLERYREHVYSGVEVLLGQRIVDAVVKGVNVAFLHHFRYDGTGYPRAHAVKAQNFYSRVVQVADFYDNESFAGPEGVPVPPDRIFRDLMDRGGTEFDPLVVKAFVNLLGLYPVGCIVCLDTGEIGTVIAAATDSRYLDRPVVRVFMDSAGGEVERTVNLMDRDPTGAFTASILKIYQQEEVRLEMEEYLSVI